MMKSLMSYIFGLFILLSSTLVYSSPSTIGARVYSSANQTIPSYVLTPLNFNLERYDTNIIHDNIINNSRLTAKTPGKYLICGSIQWDIGDIGFRGILIVKNGIKTIAEDTGLPISSMAGKFMSICTIYQLNVDSYVELKVIHSKGMDLNIIYQPNTSPEFEMTLIQD